MILLVSSSVCLLFLILHSVFSRPLRATLIFFLMAIPLSHSNLGDDYIFHIATPEWLSTQFVNDVGFLFAYYCSAAVATQLVRHRGGVVSYFPLVFWSVVVMGCIGSAVEHTNELAGWWSWIVYEDQDFDYFMPWVMHGLILFPIYFHFFIWPPTDRTRFRRFLLGWVAVVVFWPYVLPKDMAPWVFAPAFFVAAILAIRNRQLRVRLDLLQKGFSVPLPDRMHPEPPIDAS